MDCPECGKPNRAKAKVCYECGAILAIHKPEAERDFRCEYREGGERCRSLGTMSHDTGEKRTWFCRGHYHADGDPVIGHEVLIRSRPQQPNLKGIGWRDDMVDARVVNSGLVRRSNETRSAYLARSRTALKEAVNKFRASAFVKKSEPVTVTEREPGADDDLE